MASLRVQPRESVKQDHTKRNIEINLKLIKKWLPHVRKHNRIAYICSAGPSLDSLLKLGFISSDTFKISGNDLFCVKHALPILSKHNIIPNFCIVLDPRDINKTSTHGVVRKDLFKTASKETTFLVASTTDPSVTEYLLSEGFLVIGWHALNSASKDFQDVIPYWISGGTCAATRGILLCDYMGYSKANLIAYDATLAKPPENPDEKTYFDDNVNWNDFVNFSDKTVDWKAAETWIKENSSKNEVPKYLPLTIQGSDVFWSTGELAAMLQDLEGFLKDPNFPVEIKLIGCDKEAHAAGAMFEVFDKKGTNMTIRPKFEEIFNV